MAPTATKRPTATAPRAAADPGGARPVLPGGVTPRSEPELLHRARELAGLSLGELAERLSVPVPPDLRRAKGWVGTLLELALGATAKSRSVPDFEELGVELKSLPVDASGKPLETTFVCTIDLLAIGNSEWKASRLLRKLQRVLWVPVQGERRIEVGRRRIGTALLWSPSEAEERDLRFDWEELSGLIGRGEVESITGHLGKFLQVRPKARDSRARRIASGVDGERIDALPRGFYLRTAFTTRILARNFILPRPIGTDLPQG